VGHRANSVSASFTAVLLLRFPLLPSPSFVPGPEDVGPVPPAIEPERNPGSVGRVSRDARDAAERDGVRKVVLGGPGEQRFDAGHGAHGGAEAASGGREGASDGESSS